MGQGQWNKCADVTHFITITNQPVEFDTAFTGWLPYKGHASDFPAYKLYSIHHINQK